MTVADTVVTTINSPSLNIVWGLCKSLFDAGMKLREKKALEWIGMIKENPSIFTEQILKNVQFQDGFVYVFENFLKERNEEKRKCYKKIFINFTSSKKYIEYPIETYINILSQLEPNDFILLKKLNTDIENSKHKIVDKVESDIRQFDNLIRLRIIELPRSGDLKRQLGELIGLSPFDNKMTQMVRFSEFGKKLVSFVIS